MVSRSFDVCGIASMDPKMVHSAPFYQECMEIGKATANLNMDSLEDEEEDPFDL